MSSESPSATRFSELISLSFVTFQLHENSLEEDHDGCSNSCTCERTTDANGYGGCSSSNSVAGNVDNRGLGLGWVESLCRCIIRVDTDGRRRYCRCLDDFHPLVNKLLIALRIDEYMHT